MTENSAPSGFQHLEQPQMWLWLTLLASCTSTFSDAQWQRRRPPLKSLEPSFRPESMLGCSGMGRSVRAFRRRRAMKTAAATAEHRSAAVDAYFLLRLICEGVMMILHGRCWIRDTTSREGEVYAGC